MSLDTIWHDMYLPYDDTLLKPVLHRSCLTILINFYFRKLNFFRTVKRNAEPEADIDEVEPFLKEGTLERHISVFNACMRAAIESFEP